jgi:hypothetical protein
MMMRRIAVVLGATGTAALCWLAVNGPNITRR